MLYFYRFQVIFKIVSQIRRRPFCNFLKKNRTGNRFGVSAVFGAEDDFYWSYKARFKSNRFLQLREIDWIRNEFSTISRSRVLSETRRTPAYLVENRFLKLENVFFSFYVFSVFFSENRFFAEFSDFSMIFTFFQFFLEKTQITLDSYRLT